MEIEGYKYIQHNITPRPWGVECQFTAARLTDGYHFNEIVMISGEKAEEKEIVELITAHLKKVDRPREPLPLPERIYTEAEVAVSLAEKDAEFKSLLVEKGFISIEQKVTDIESKANIIAQAKEAKEVEEVKP